MATVYDTPQYGSPAVGLPLGLVFVPVKYTVGSVAIAQSTGDYIRVCKLPKGAQIVPELCSIFADADPDSGANLTVSLKVTDGTTTKTIISTQNFQAIDTRLVASAADITGLGLFKTSNDDFYVKLTPEAGDLDAAAVIYVVVAYNMQTSFGAATT